MSENNLKPCPFCGGKVNLEEFDDEAYMITCDNCHSATSFGIVFEDGTAGDATKEETVTAWNRRADNA